MFSVFSFSPTEHVPYVEQKLMSIQSKDRKKIKTEKSFLKGKGIFGGKNNEKLTSDIV